MPLVNLQTNLKSLKYGTDIPGGGSSGEPYVQNDINNPTNLVGLYNDQFIRGGGIGAIEHSLLDTKRIGKFFLDSPKGPLFIAKQVGLQLSNPKLEVKTGNNVNGLLNNLLTGDLGSLTNGLLEPTRLYNLGINTIAQVPVEAFGEHFVRHGLLPVQNDSTKYEAVVTYNNNNDANRLLQYTNNFSLGNQPVSRNPTLSSLSNFIDSINTFTGLNIPNFKATDTIIDNYVSGPNSTYGIGNTLISRTTFTADADAINKAFNTSNQVAGLAFSPDGDRRGLNYTRGLGINNQIQDDANAISSYSTDIPNNNAVISSQLNAFTYSNVNGEYVPLSKTGLANTLVKTTSHNPSYAAYQKLISSKILTDNSYKDTDGTILNQFDIFNRDSNDVIQRPAVNYRSTNSAIGYRNEYGEVFKVPGSWNKLARENRVGSGRQDSINLTPIFTTGAGSFKDRTVTINGNKTTVNDLVKFQIQALHTDSPNNADWMVFRAYLTDLNDGVNASWTDIKYAGRGDKFYIYEGFSRKMSVSFKVAALSHDEMKPMYQKLNFLMSNLMPDYSSDNLMRGPLVRMTIGNYIDGQLAKLDDVSYRIPQDSPWEIAINDTELILPHIIEVTLSFTPIGSQTRDQNLIASKTPGNTTSHIAQNWNGASDKAGEYINPDKSSVYSL
jgi:hypothetical protein